jgi:hypothetical protein
LSSQVKIQMVSLIRNVQNNYVWQSTQSCVPAKTIWIIGKVY